MYRCAPPLVVVLERLRGAHYRPTGGFWIFVGAKFFLGEFFLLGEIFFLYLGMRLGMLEKKIGGDLDR